jgi:tRNA(Arg) A34 adenosine deaminase TadA
MANKELCMWERLLNSWQICVEEAWTAYCAGSIPIGAAITDSAGQLVARGHNRIHASIDPANRLAQHRLAHAEMNALLALDPQIDPRMCTLYTTTEPCPLCIGALCIMPVRAFHYAACDPTAGSACLLDATPFLRSRGIQACGPTDPLFEVLLVALRVEWRLRTANGQPGKVIAALSTVVPSGVQLGTALYRSDVVAELRRKDRSAREMITTIAAIQSRLESA